MKHTLNVLLVALIAGVLTYLFGSILTVSPADTLTIVSLGLFIVVTVGLGTGPLAGIHGQGTFVFTGPASLTDVIYYVYTP